MGQILLVMNSHLEINEKYLISKMYLAFFPHL